MTGASVFLLEYFGDPRDTYTTLDVNKTDYRRPEVSLDRSKLFTSHIAQLHVPYTTFQLAF